MTQFTANNALPYNTAMELVKELENAGLQASVVMGGIRAYTENETQEASLYAISAGYGVLFFPGSSGKNQYGKPPEQ